MFCSASGHGVYHPCFVLSVLAAICNLVLCNHHQVAVTPCHRGPASASGSSWRFGRHTYIPDNAWQSQTCLLLCRLFGMPIALALTAGFIQSAISPTVLVTGMLELQRRGYGQEKGQSCVYVGCVCMHPSCIQFLCFCITAPEAFCRC